MKKAVLASRGEAERRLKEASLARKRARESLLDVESNAAKEKARSAVVDASKDKISHGVTLPERQRYPGEDRGNGLDHSCEVSANLDDKDRILRFRAQSISNGVSMGAQDKGRAGVARTSLQNNVSVNEKERSEILAHYNGLEEKANKTAPFVLQGRNSSQ